MERLKTLAKRIESLFPDLITQLGTCTVSTDRHPKGVRWRIPGKGRKGTRLRVWERTQDRSMEYPILDHKAGGTYRSNRDVANWIEQEARRRAGRT